MPVVDTFVFFLGGCFGGAVVWHCKPFLQTFWRSAQSAKATLSSEILAIQAKLAKL